MIEQRRQQNEEELLAEMRARVDESNGGYANKDARLDAQEEAVAEARRQEHSDEQRTRQEEARVFLDSKLEMRRQAATALREGTSGRMGAAIAANHRRNAESADQKRRDTARVQARFAKEKKERLSRAMENRDRIRAERVQRSLNREERIRLKVLLGTQMEKFDDAQIAEAKAKIVRSKQDVRDSVYGSRYVSQEAATEMAGTSFERLFYMHVDDKIDAEIDAANAEMLKRIETVAQRTDDEIVDDTAGEARAKFAAMSRARKNLEQARISRANAEHRARVHELRYGGNEQALDAETSAEAFAVD